MEVCHTQRREDMRTNVVIDDDLMKSAFKVADAKTKKGVIEEGLRILAQVKRLEALKPFRGKLRWSVGLEEMRLDK